MLIIQEVETIGLEPTTSCGAEKAVKGVLSKEQRPSRVRLLRGIPEIRYGQLQARSARAQASELDSATEFTRLRFVLVNISGFQPKRPLH